ncbi:MAG: hypothetical protein IPM95_14805 [Sphingobacteriales bacterium]|jgi:hypothetical protein|nr:hypothetical protein [Sphingobacteriales bacterium]
MKQIKLRESKILLDAHLSIFFDISLNDLRNSLEQHKDKFKPDSYFFLTNEEISNLRKNLIINDLDDLNESNIAFKPDAAIQLSFYLDTKLATWFRQEVLSSFKNFVVDNINYNIIRHFDGMEQLVDLMFLITDRKENFQMGFKINKNLNS